MPRGRKSAGSKSAERTLKLDVSLNNDTEYGKGVHIVELEGGMIGMFFDGTANLGPSKSGKTLVVATTQGNIEVGDVRIGLNAYRYR